MSEVVDLIHRLSYEVQGVGDLKTVLDDLRQQSQSVDLLKARLASLNEAYKTETNVKAQQNLSGAIIVTTQAIERQQAAMNSQVAQSKPLQQALTTELGIIQKLTDKINDLKHARERATSTSQIADTNREIARAKAELATLTNPGSGGGAGGEGSIFTGLFGGGGSLGRQILTGSLIGLGIGGGLGLITRAVSALVEELQQLGIEYLHTDTYQNKLKDDMESLDGTISKSIDKFAEFSKTLSQGFNVGEDSFKQFVDLVKATGVVNDEVFNASKKQLDAEHELRMQQVEDIENLQSKYNQISRFFSNFDKSGDLNFLRKQIGTLGLPTEVERETNEAITKFLTARGKLPEKDRGKFLLSEQDDIPGKAAQNEAKAFKILSDDKNAQVKFTEDINREFLAINKKLNVDIAQENEKYRELKEKEDIASVDKITKDIAAKYKALIVKLGKEEEIELKKLPAGDPRTAEVKGKYGRLLSLLTGERKQDTSNQIFEFNRSQFLLQESNQAAQSAGAAGQASFAARFGLPDYDKLSEAQDKIKQSKLDAASSTFIALHTKYEHDGQKTIEIEKQYATQVIQIEQQAYTDRLKLADDFFTQLSQQVIAVNNLLSTENAVDILTSKKPDRIKERRLRKNQANQQIGTANRLIPKAEDAVDQNKADAINAASTDETEAAVNSTIAAQQKLANLEKSKAEGEKILHDIHKEQVLEDIGLFQTFTEETVKGYNIISEARQKDLDREISVRTERVDLAYKLAERGNTQALAAEQKALEQAQQQKRAAALKEQEINAALTVSNALVAVAKAAAEGGVAAPATIALAIAAIGIGFAEADALSASQKQEFYKGGFTGEGGKYEPAGVVHKGEFVFDKETTSRHREYFEAIHKGYDPIPALALPEHRSSSSNFATKDDMVRHGQLIVDAIAGKQVDVTQVMDKRGLYQSVVEHKRAEGRKWAN